MGFHVSDAALLQTTKCIRHLSCLSGDAYRLCKVQDTVLSDNFTLIECTDDKPCAYNVSSGSVHICKCPIRAELHRRYGI